MAGDALVVRGRLDLVAAPAGRVGGVHEEDAAAAAVLGRREVEGDRAVRRGSSTSQSAFGRIPNQSPMAARALAIAVFDAATISSAFVWWSAAIVAEARAKIFGTSSVPTTSWPSVRYSRASYSTCARPMSWISWALSSSVV